MTNQHYSPLRYPGGKSSLYDFLKRTIQQNQIHYGIYVEGFAGGAGAALKLLMLEDVWEIYLNDKDEFIYKFWKAVLNDTDGLLRLINDINPTLDEWIFRKSVLNDKVIQQDISDTQIGFTAFFLNRCNRSGILKSGAIGGNEQLGKWKIDARYNKEDLMERIKRIAFYKDRIHLFNEDVITFLKKIKSMQIDKSELIIYLDPPYVQQGKELYRYYYKKEDHKKLASYLQKHIQNKWLVSYDDDELIHSIYSNLTRNFFEFNYYANKTKIGKELIIPSDNCILTDTYIHYSKKKKLEGSTFLKQAI